MSRWKALAVAATIPAAEYEPRLVDALETFARLAQILDEHMPHTDRFGRVLVPHPDSLIEGAADIAQALEDRTAEKEASETDAEGFEAERDEAREQLERALIRENALAEKLAAAREKNEQLVGALFGQAQAVKDAALTPKTTPSAALKADNKRLAGEVLRLQTANAERGQALAELIVKTESLEAEIKPLRVLRDALRTCLTPMASEFTHS